MQNQAIRKFISENIAYVIVPIEDGKFNLLSEDKSPAKLMFSGDESKLEEYIACKFEHITWK